MIEIKFRLAMCKNNDNYFVTPIEESRIEIFENDDSFLFWVNDLQVISFEEKENETQTTRRNS